MNRPASILSSSAKPATADPTTTAVIERLDGEPLGHASNMILGHNLEAWQGTIDTMLTDLLDNPKFLGPANAQTGIAEPWQPRGNHLGGVSYELTPGLSLSGNEAQLIQSFTAAGRPTLLQNNRRVRAGQTYEVELWAKARHRPVDIELELLPQPSRQPAYDQAKLTVDASYWKCYRANLTATCDDDQAVFALAVVGEGVLWIDQVHLRPQGESHIDQNLIQQIGDLNIPALRFPGGCTSTNYRWKHGTGPIHLRPRLHDAVAKQHACYDFGTDEYLELCLTHDILPHITVNIGSGTPEEAADWARYVRNYYLQRDRTPPPAYFQMGNEQYGVWETSHMTGSMYVEALRDFVPRVRGAYPEARIVALGEPIAFGLRPEFDTRWRQAVLEDAADLFDVIAINRYKGQWFDTDHDRMVNASESIGKIDQDLVELRDDCRARGIKAGVALTEWNYWLHAAHWDGKDFREPYDAQHTLFIAGMIHAMARLGSDMELANFYHLVNGMGVFACENGRTVPTAAADLFAAYGHGLPGEVMPIEVQSPHLANQQAIDALCLRTPGATHIYILNFDPVHPIRVDLNHFPGDVEVISAMSADTPLQVMRPTNIRPDHNDSVTLPPLTLLHGSFSDNH